jgi:hypothetical protein
MSVAIDEERARWPRLGLAVGFAEGPPGGGGAADLWRRVLFTLGALILFRLATYLPIPGIDPIAVVEFFRASGSEVLDLIDLFGGGGLSRLSIATLGIAPYISALVIVQLASHVVPRLRSLATEGSAGRRVLNQYARVLRLPLPASRPSASPSHSRVRVDWWGRRAVCSRLWLSSRWLRARSSSCGWPSR